MRQKVDELINWPSGGDRKGQRVQEKSQVTSHKSQEKRRSGDQENRGSGEEDAVREEGFKAGIDVVGNIEAQGKVEITHSANFIGEIHARGIAVENGADFNGTVELNRGSHKKTATDKTAAKMSKSQPQQNQTPQNTPAG